MVRLIRSKGVGVYFVTQNPLDVPDTVLGQLGNRVQHALRAFTPRDQKAVRAAAETMRANPKFDAEQAITELGVGEALVSLLDEKGRPRIVERALRRAAGVADRPDRRRASARRCWHLGRRRGLRQERWTANRPTRNCAATATASAARRRARRPRAERRGGQADQGAAGEVAGGMGGSITDALGGALGGVLGGSGRKDSVIEAVAKSAARSIGSTLGREIIRGVLGSFLRKR